MRLGTWRQHLQTAPKAKDIISNRSLRLTRLLGATQKLERSRRTKNTGKERRKQGRREKQNRRAKALSKAPSNLRQLVPDKTKEYQRPRTPHHTQLSRTRFRASNLKTTNITEATKEKVRGTRDNNGGEAALRSPSEGVVPSPVGADGEGGNQIDLGKAGPGDEVET